MPFRSRKFMYVSSEKCSSVILLTVSSPTAISFTQIWEFYRWLYFSFSSFSLSVLFLLLFIYLFFGVLPGIIPHLSLSYISSSFLILHFCYVLNFHEQCCFLLMCLFIDFYSYFIYKISSPNSQKIIVVFLKLPLLCKTAIASKMFISFVYSLACMLDTRITYLLVLGYPLMFKGDGGKLIRSSEHMGEASL